MPSDRTTVTELGTALGMLGTTDVDEALRSRTPVMHSVSPEMWERLSQLRSGGAYDAEFHAAFANGRAFLLADDGLRGRLPRIIEWKGTGRAPGDEVAPIDLRVDHVYLVSCKYLSNILFNVSPAHIFDELLTGRPARSRSAGGGSGGDWYAEVAPQAHQALYDEVRRALVEAVESVAPGSPSPTPSTGAGRSRAAVGAVSLGVAAFPGLEDAPEADRRGRHHESPATPPPLLRQLPARVVDLTAEQRDALGDWLKAGWPGEARGAYQRLAAQVSLASAERWQRATDERSGRGGRGEAMLWRLLRMGSAPYFVLGSSATRSLRLRIATPWDWREHFTLASMVVTAQEGGQPRVGWHASVRSRSTSEVFALEGHIEVRWSHGRFGGPPEAKGYLDTPHHLVPGYFSLQ